MPRDKKIDSAKKQELLVKRLVELKLGELGRSLEQFQYEMPEVRRAIRGVPLSPPRTHTPRTLEVVARRGLGKAENASYECWRRELERSTLLQRPKAERSATVSLLNTVIVRVPVAALLGDMDRVLEEIKGRLASARAHLQEMEELARRLNLRI